MKSAIRSPNLKIWPLIKRPLRPLAFQDPSAFIARKLVSGSPSGHCPAPKRRKRARGRLSQKLWPSPGKLFREARRASPQRQNNGARASDGAGLPWLSRKLQPSPGKRARATRPSDTTKRPLRLAGLDKIAILQALDKNGSAWPLINSLHGTILNRPSAARI